MRPLARRAAPSLAITLALLCAHPAPAAAQSADSTTVDSTTAPPSTPASQNAYIGGEKDFDDMDQQERDAAKAAARTRKYTNLRVCADPGNMPFSNNKAEGFENKIAEALAEDMGAHVSYAWRPTFERGLTRQPMQELNICDVMVGVPTDYEALLTTASLYRSTYVFAYRSDRGIKIKGLTDPALKKLRIGVYETSGLRNALANHGAKSNVQVMATSHDADLVPAHQPWHQVEQVVDGQLDVAAVWGPFAGWVKKTRDAPLTLQPTNLMDDHVPMEFSVAIGVRRFDAVLKYALENAMEDKKDAIAKILSDYGVPLVQCSDCLISGDIPAHGDYIIQPTEDETADRPPIRTDTPRAQVDQWLAQGSDINDELDSAALAADLERVKYLLTKKGVDINNRGNDGETPLHLAVANSDNEMIAYLLDHKAKIDQTDSDGYTPLALGAARDKTSSIKLLASRHADLETQIPGGYTPLFIALGQGKLSAAKALIEAGARCDVFEGKQHFSMLMAVATQRPPERRLTQVMQKVGPVEVAQDLIKHSADVNAATPAGVTATMIAAAHDNAPMIGLLAHAGARLDAKSAEGQTALDIANQNGSDSAVRMLQLMQDTAISGTSSGMPATH
ncbi:MAG TPA: quinoprotein dehydrogenase-associated putative ABC transporter substrate-binding protein [Steroidobacteraceae bacterium]|jgi:quinoprotein dehydrogenase-associated probable ABC transporter substrate-binding protein